MNEYRHNDHPPRFCSQCKLKHPVQGGRYREFGTTRRWVCAQCLDRAKAREAKERVEADK